MDYMGLALPLVEARVDWITCTAKRGSRANELVELAERELLAQENYGDKFDEWRFQGYQGFQCGDARWGWGKNGSIVVMSKESAHNNAPYLAHKADHWSRIDYCVTVFDVTRKINPPTDYWEAYDSRYPNRDAPIRLQRIQDYQRGSTVTLGARTAATFLRVYDKYWESNGDYALGCWRWELELKREQAEAQQTRWLETIVVSSYISGLVKGWAESHHCLCPFSASAILQPCHQLRHTRDADRTLAWLSTQVQPSVEWVSAARGEKKVKEVLRLN